MPPRSRSRPPLRARDLLLNLAAYCYFVPGFLLVVSPWLLWIALRWRGFERTVRLQHAISWFLRGFFRLLIGLAPALRLEVPADLSRFRGRILVCNHISYLDPLLFVATFDRHQSVVKPSWFYSPGFGTVIRAMGYLAPLGTARHTASLLARLEATRVHLEGGGVLFIFPEGHRSRDGRPLPFDPGAFKLARLLGVDVVLTHISGTDQVLPPGSALLRSQARAPLRLRILDIVPAHALERAASLRALVAEAAARYAAEAGASSPPDARPGRRAPSPG